MRQTYTILWKPETGSDSRTGNQRNFGPEGSAASPPARIEVSSLDEKEAAEAAIAPRVDAIAPSIPTRLIEPLASAANEDEICWGLTAVGAESSRYTGRGVRVAVLDTGIERGHAAFAGVNIVEQDFTRNETETEKVTVRIAPERFLAAMYAVPELVLPQEFKMHSSVRF